MSWRILDLMLYSIDIQHCCVIVGPYLADDMKYTRLIFSTTALHYMRCFDSQEYLALIRGGGYSEFVLKMNEGTEAETEHILLQQLILN